MWIPVLLICLVQGSSTWCISPCVQRETYCTAGDFSVRQSQNTSPAPATQAEAWDCRIKEVGTTIYHFHCRMKGRSVTSHLCQMTNTLWQPRLISKCQQQKMILCLRNLTVWEFYLKSYKGQLCFHLKLRQKV